MWKIVAVVALSLVALLQSVAVPLHAQNLEEPECSDANLATAAEKIDKMKDGPNKTTALSEIGQARKQRADGNQDQCKGHMLKATLQTK